MNLESLAAELGRSIGSEMLPNYDDFLIKRFEQPDEVPAFAKASAYVPTSARQDGAAGADSTIAEVVTAR